MNKKKPLHLFVNEGYYYIRYKDLHNGLWKSVSTGIKSTKANFKKALQYRDQFLKELLELADLSFKEGSIHQGFEHFKEINYKKSLSTKLSYDYLYKHLEIFLDVHQPCIILDKNKAEEFMIWLDARPKFKQNTKFGIAKNFKKFLKFLFQYQYLSKEYHINPDLNFHIQITEPILFTTTDRNKIVRGLSRIKKNTNFKLMIMMLLYTGLRPSDIINITTDQINIKDNTVRYYSTKVKCWYLRPLHPKIHPALKARIKEVKTGRLFDYSEVRNMGRAVRRYFEELGMKGKKYNLQTFRKDFISRAQESDIAVNAASILVGHNNIKTTMDHYTKLSTKYLARELKKLK
jgi:integrase